MEKTMFKKALSLFISILMVFTMIPATVFTFAAEDAYPVMEAYNAASSGDYHRYYDKVYSVTFLDKIDYGEISAGDTLYSWDVSAAKDGSVMAWMKKNAVQSIAAGADRYDVYIAGEGGVGANPDSSWIFYAFSSLERINNPENFKTGTATTFYNLFANCTALEEVDLNSWDVSNVTTLRNLFSVCNSLKEVDLSSWNVSKVTSLRNMFYRCYDLGYANLSGWDTSNVTDMYGVFEMSPPQNVSPDYSLKNVDLSGWDTSNVTTMENMFKNCEALTELDLSSFNTSKVTNMRFMFYYCKQLKNIYVGDGWTTESIANINDGIFNCCYALIGGTDDAQENQKIYNDKHPSAYYPPSIEYAKLREEGGYLTDASEKPQPEKKKYTVTYEFIGGVVPEGVTAPSQTVYEEGTTVSVAQIPSAEGYEFSGWSTQDADITSDSFVIENDVHIVGSWTEIKLYKVEYKYTEGFLVPEGAPALPPAVSYKAGDWVDVNGVYYVDGYLFIGWYTEDADIAGDMFSMPEKDVTLYGYFKKPVESIEIINEGDIVINEGDEAKINVYVKPEDATIKDIIYESSNKSVVTVDKYGNIETVGEGTATITVYSKDDPTKSDTVTVTVKKPATEITVDKTEINLNKGDSDKITATVNEDATNKKVIYESSDETVVKVDENGNIEAVGEGTAIITVKSDDDPKVKKEIKVTVKVPVTEVTATDDFTLNVGEEKNVDASVNEDATNKELIYESSDPGVAKVDPSGNVIAVGEGTATITVTSKDDPTKKDTITVTVKVPVTDITVDKDDITLDVGESEKVTVTVTPDNATEKEVIFESADETVVTVDKDGNITAVGEGTATITVTSKDDPTKKDSITVTVKVPEPVKIPVTAVTIENEDTTLNINDELVLDVAVNPENATNAEVTFESSDETVVTVDENGKITAVGEGIATVTVTSNDDPTKKDTITVTVKVPEVYVPVTNITASDDFTLEIGEEKNIDASVNEDATNKDLTYSSGDETVATVDENGKVTAIGEGTVTITITSADNSGITETVVVTVKKTEHVIEAPDSITITENEIANLGVKVTPDEGAPEITYTSADESIVKVDSDGNIVGVGVGTTTVTADIGNGKIKVITVTVTAVVVPAPLPIPIKHHIAFGKTDGIGWYEVSVNGGDFFPQGPNSTLEVAKGSVLVVRVQDLWIDDDFTFYVNGEKVEKDAANCITVVVDGYMLIGALSMDFDVPDVEESLNWFQKIIKAIKDFFQMIIGWFK